MRLRRTLGTAALLLAATACSGEPEVIEPKPSDSSSATPSVAAPTMPAQAKEDSDEGAVAFVGYWIKTFNEAATSGETRSLEELASDCRACNSYAAAIRQTHRDGEAPDGAIWKVGQLAVESTDKSTDVIAEVQTRSKDGPSKHEIAFILTPQAPWSVTDMYRVEH